MIIAPADNDQPSGYVMVDTPRQSKERGAWLGVGMSLFALAAFLAFLILVNVIFFWVVVIAGGVFALVGLHYLVWGIFVTPRHRNGDMPNQRFGPSNRDTADDQHATFSDGAQP